MLAQTPCLHLPKALAPKFSLVKIIGSLVVVTVLMIIMTIITPNSRHRNRVNNVLILSTLQEDSGLTDACFFLSLQNQEIFLPISFNNALVTIVCLLSPNF